MKQRILSARAPILGAALLLAAVLVLRREFETYHLRDVVGHLRAIPAQGLARALMLTVLGYVTLTGYDALAFRYIRNPLAYRSISLVSFVAYVFSHNVGLSFFGGSAVRYRMLSGWGVRTEEIARVIAFALLTFWLGFFLLGGALHTLWPLSANLPGFRLASTRPVGLALLAAVGAYVLLVTLRREPLHLRGFQVELPDLRITAVQLALSTLDWLLAASVLIRGAAHRARPGLPGLRGRVPARAGRRTDQPRSRRPRRVRDRHGAAARALPPRRPSARLHRRLPHRLLPATCCPWPWCSSPATSCASVEEPSPA